eukprot:2758961-Pyramimonas_sp.AAC.1
MLGERGGRRRCRSIPQRLEGAFPSRLQRHGQIRWVRGSGVRAVPRRAQEASQSPDRSELARSRAPQAA